MIEQISIKNFRAFKELEISKLGRVNLIVGKNNVGKTALIEAIQIYLKGSDIAGAAEYLYDKDEVTYFNFDPGKFEPNSLSINFLSLFNGDSIVIGKNSGIEISEKNKPDSALRAYLDMVFLSRHKTSLRRVNEKIHTAFEIEQEEEEEEAEEVVFLMEKGKQKDLIPLSETFDSRTSFRRMLSRKRTTNNEPVEILSIPSGPIPQSEIARYWDNISLRKNEERVLELIRKIAPVEGLSFIQKNPNRIERSIIVKLEGKEQPLPLKSMGEGLSRIVQIALTLEHDEAKKYQTIAEPLFKESNPKTYLFIDELENGIHYSALDSIWDFIFRVSEEREMQVFVTTHSWDCIQSFQRVANKYTSSLGILVNIQDTKSGKKAFCYSEDELNFISKNQIEVR